MNIKQAKEYIKNTVQLYLKKNEFGEYRIPVVRQRPIFLLGAPGIGKTAIMEQIAQEMGIALVSYSMTHHTRQSALGLPFITEKIYGGEKYSVSEYTMSEIISFVYETMENSGMQEGILFLDEINCVSETLAPSMLQFLQYKVFGRHKVPEGWVVVTAGNPPEYNKSVREFDVVTLDRLKILEVEPDLRVWKEYASDRQLHNAVLSYLDLKKEHFYCMEMTVKGRSYVTARGWEDLSQVLSLYEEAGLAVDETLVGQYLRNDKVVKEFTAYYDLYNKYKRDYHIEEILNGNPSVEAVERAKQAAFDERLSLLGMLLDRVQADMKSVCEQAAYITDLRKLLQPLGEKTKEETAEQFAEELKQLLEKRRKMLAGLRSANSLSDTDLRKHNLVNRFLEEAAKGIFLGDCKDGVSAYASVKEKYASLVAQMKNETEQTKAQLHCLFAFVEEAFAEGNEMLILVTELTVNQYSSGFIAMFGSADYTRHNEEMMLSERGDGIREEILKLGLE